jgi:peptidyl-prolyl cis-trans isomerase D
MFDLFRSRDKAIRYLLGALLTVVALSMVTYLIPGFGLNTGAPTNPVLATVAGKKITLTEAQEEFKRVSNGKIPEDLMEQYAPQIVNGMIQRQAVIYEAERLGLSVSDDEVLNALMAAFPQFFQNGVLNNAQFEAALAQEGLTSQGAVDEMRGDLLTSKLQSALLASVVVTPKEIEDAYKEKYDRMKIEYMTFPPAKFRSQAKVSDDEVHKAYDASKARYMKPEQRSFQVLVLDQAKVEASLTVTDDQLRAAYSASLDSFREPEQVHARHILLKTEGKSDAEKKAIKAKAEDLLKQLKNGADFAELAKKNSEDSAESGGDLGWFTRGRMVPEFEDAAFSLKPNQLSGIVTSQYGYHIIQVLEKKPARVKPFEEVKDELAKEVRAQQVNDRIEMLGDQMHDELSKAPKSAADVAKKVGAELITVPDAQSGAAIPGLGVSPEIDTALAGMKVGDVSPVLYLPENRLAVAVLTGQTPGRPQEFSEVENQVRDGLLNTKAGQIASESAKQAVERLKKGEDFEKVAKSMGLEVTTSGNFGRSDSIKGLGEANYIADSFNKPVGTVIGPATIDQVITVAKIVEKTPADLTALPIERDALFQELKNKKQQERSSFLLDGIEAKLSAEGKIVVNDKEIQNLAASYHQQQ